MAPGTPPTHESNTMTSLEHLIEWDDNKVSRLWNYYSRTPPYSDIYFAKLFGGRILERSGVPLQEELEVLDFGCGPGFIWDHLVRLGARWSYAALDFSPDSVKQVQKKGTGHRRFKGAEHVVQLPCSSSDSSFDVVLLLEVVEHLTDAHMEATLTEVARVLKQGGVVVVTTPNDENLAASTKFCPECGAIFHEWQHVRTWTVGSLRSRMLSRGFTLQMAKTLDFEAAGAMGWAIQLARRLSQRSNGKPHMIATFQKN
jgi:2-polyprenyl-3-methyl-5-hydroxy-6-metoxy-1,4-benzoquinol methylase